MQRRAFFIHGMWSRPLVWNLWKTAFEAAGYESTAVALPGHRDQDTDGDLVGLGLADYVASVLKEIQGIDRPILVGHSMGGLIAQLVAVKKPLAAAILINSAAPAPIFPLRPKMLPGLARHFARWNLWQSAFHLSRWEADYLLFGGIPPTDRPQLHAQLIGESGRIAYELGYGSLNRSRTNYVARATVDCPLLALAGVRDRIIPIDVSRAMAKYYGSTMTYREFDDRSHWIIGEARYTDRIRDVLAWLANIGDGLVAS